jgi:cobalt/nickel transport system ATP-binding protein
MTNVAVEMRDTSYVYPDGFVALENVNLRVLSNERVGILGPNGAGKSTLLMLISGLFTPSKGSVHVLDIPVDKSNAYKIRSKVGIVFQDSDIQLFCPTLLEDITFGLLNMGLPEEEIARRTEEALKIVGLEGYEEKAPHHLSMGEKKKASIAAVLAMKPEILLLDEPTANLDPRSRSELISLLNDLYKNQKITLITATHDVNFVPMVMDRVYILNKGRTVTEGSVREVFSDSKTMKEANLEPPIATHIYNLLSEQRGTTPMRPIPLTVEETLHAIRSLMKRNKT